MFLKLLLHKCQMALCESVVFAAGNDLYDAFAHSFGRRSRTRKEYLRRLQNFHSNKAHVDTHNQRVNDSGHRQAIILSIAHHAT